MCVQCTCEVMCNNRLSIIFVHMSEEDAIAYIPVKGDGTTMAAPATSPYHSY